MRVLKEPEENDKLPTMEVSCTGLGFKDKGCGRLLEASFTDIHSGTHKDYGGGTDTYYYIICPKCGAKTEVFKGQMPKEMISLVK